MTPMAKSKLCWFSGAVAGAVLSRERPILGAALGAILVGVVGDKLIEKYDPNYRPGYSAVDDVRAIADRMKAPVP